MCLRVDLVPEDHNQIEGNAEIAGDEVLIVKVAVRLGRVDKDVEALEDGDENAKGECAVGAGDPKRRSKSELVVSNALRTAGTHKVDVRDKNGYPRQKPKDGDEIDKVTEDGFGVVRHVHECEQCEHGAEPEGIYRNATPIGAGKDSESFAFDRKTVDGAGSDVQIRVRRAQHENQNTTVEDGRKRFDAGQFDGDHKR